MAKFLVKPLLWNHFHETWSTTLQTGFSQTCHITRVLVELHSISLVSPCSFPMAWTPATRATSGCFRLWKLPHWGGCQDKTLDILLFTFSRAISCLKIVVFNSNFFDVYSQWFSWQQVNTVSSNVLVLDYYCHYLKHCWQKPICKPPLNSYGNFVDLGLTYFVKVVCHQPDVKTFEILE